MTTSSKHSIEYSQPVLWNKGRKVGSGGDGNEKKARETGLSWVSSSFFFNYSKFLPFICNLIQLGNEDLNFDLRSVHKADVSCKLLPYCTKEQAFIQIIRSCTFPHNFFRVLCVRTFSNSGSFAACEIEEYEEKASMVGLLRRWT